MAQELITKTNEEIVRPCLLYFFYKNIITSLMQHKLLEEPTVHVYYVNDS